MRKEYDFSQGKRGPVLQSPGKIRITIMLDDDVIEFFRNRAKSLGVGYQTLINAALRAAMEQSSKAALGLKLLQSVREMKAGKAARVTRVELT